MRDWECEIADSADNSFNILADRKAALSRKTRKPNFEQIIEKLREHAFHVEPSTDVARVLVTKYGAGAVLAAAADKAEPVAYAVHPGVLVEGQVARLVDRGHQKFIQTPQLELPATASQLHAIHRFSEELKQLTGDIDLYNESLGTTSDVYLYDRLKGREAV
jgi:2-C-methyl-D-erythritol 4-phosphate cytidylyltransferase